MPQTWLVTGANRGLGLEMARQLVHRGDTVIATARDVAGATALAGLGVRVEPLEVADADSVAALALRLDGAPIDVVVNNAGYGTRAPTLADLDVAELEHYFRVNAMGPLRVTKALLPNLRAGGARRVVQVTSKMGSIADNQRGGSYGYRASKAALNMINQSLSVDLREDGFTCVVLHPGWVKTDMGGARAPLDAPASVSGMVAVIDGLSPDDTGRFLNYDGSGIPW